MPKKGLRDENDEMPWNLQEGLRYENDEMPWNLQEGLRYVTLRLNKFWKALNFSAKSNSLVGLREKSKIL